MGKSRFLCTGNMNFFISTSWHYLWVSSESVSSSNGLANSVHSYQTTVDGAKRNVQDLISPFQIWVPRKHVNFPLLRNNTQKMEPTMMKLGMYTLTSFVNLRCEQRYNPGELTSWTPLVLFCFGNLLIRLIDRIKISGRKTEFMGSVPGLWLRMGIFAK